MADIDKAVELARRVTEGPNAFTPTTITLARAVLAIAAVVESARTYVDGASGDRFAAMRKALLALDAEARRG